MSFIQSFIPDCNPLSILLVGAGICTNGFELIHIAELASHHQSHLFEAGAHQIPSLDCPR